MWFDVVRLCRPSASLFHGARIERPEGPFHPAVYKGPASHAADKAEDEDRNAGERPRAWPATATPIA